MLAKLRKELEILRNKCRFIKAIIEEEVIIKRKKKVEIAKDLKYQRYATMTELNQIQNDEKKVTVVEENQNSDEEEKKEEEELSQIEEGGVAPREYDYLLSMPLWSLSLEKVLELEA